MLAEKHNLRTNLLEMQPGETQPPPKSTRKTPRQRFNLFKDLLSSQVQRRVVDELVLREVYIEPTKWNKIILFLANFYETFLIILGLALSIYQDDASSFFFQILMQIVLSYSKKGMGVHVLIQKKICIATFFLSFSIAIFKYIYMKQLEPTLAQTYQELEPQLQLLGYNFKESTEGPMAFDYWPSLEFETFSMIICFLLIRYYEGQIVHQRKVEKKEEPYHYIHHSDFLAMHRSIYILFFLTLAVDTFFSQTLTQMIVLALMLLITFLGAIKYSKSEAITKILVKTCIYLLTLQLAFLAFFEIGPVLTYFKSQESIYKLLFISGLILNENPLFMAITHIFMICFVLGFGSLYFNTYVNYLEFKKHEREFAKPEYYEAVEREKSLEAKKIKNSENKADNNDDEAALKKSPQRKSTGLLLLSKKITNFNYEKFVMTYKPYVCLWAIRGLSMVFSYAYHGFPALIILTWVLLSFIAANHSFVSCTTYVYLPVFTAGFFYTYFINIPGLFLTYENGEQQFLYPEIFNSYGRPLRFPPIEVGAMVINIIFLLLLMESKHELRYQRDEFRRAIFDKITDRKKIFLYQLFFYVLKRVHVFILFFIFLFGMRELNIYYIGLMYFFVVYTASLATFRQSGLVLVIYTASFIWLQYLWSLIEVNVEKGSFTYKLFMMLTLQKTTDDEQFQEYLEYSMPVWQWVILMLQVLMTTVNKFFLPGEVWEKSLENPLVKKKYPSLGEYYEEKCDIVLRKKFPATGRFLIKLRMIFSEMIIILILITQGFILVTQPSNLLFWGFLIFSLTLQTAVVSATEEDPKMLRGCATQSKILKLYSGWVLILQIAYHFINDKSFLAQYGFDEILQYLLGDLNEYMTIIGFENYQNSTRSIFAIFISQILFYITATYLEDYFQAQLQRIEQQERERAESQLNASMGMGLGVPVVAAPDDESNQVNNANNQSLPRDASYVQSVFKNSDTTQFGHSYTLNKPQEEEVFITKQEKINFDYENIRFSIPYMVYQRVNQWRIMDSIAMNFHLVTATVTIILCTNWQISLFMSFYLLCNVILCIRAASELHKNGKVMDLKTNEMDIDTAHRTNKTYMHNASQILIKIRTQQWTYQYWLLILSMIIMYPTPILTQLKDKMTPYQQSMTNNAIFWLFWSGVYVSPGEVQNYGNHAALYVMLILLIFEKQSQRWQKNRYGCTLQKVREFKILEEKLQLIKEDATDFQPRNTTSAIPESRPLSEFITIQEAKQECERIESLFRVQTNEIKEKRLREKIELGLKRKYSIKLRNGLKIVMEQISLQLLLFSCANKSNLVSVIYLGLLLTFLLIKNKTTGMLYMSYVFGITLAIEYILTLTNLTSLNSPMKFPKPYQEGYPSQEFPTGQFVFPWFLKVDFLRENLNWAHFFSIDVVGAQVNDIWFDFANLVILTIYFFNYGNQINANSIKVSFSQTKSLEDALDEYSRMQVMKKYLMKTKKGKNNDEEFNKAIVEEQDKEDDISGLKQSDSYEDENMSEKAADDSLEYFLGATHYLNEIKANIFIYHFTKKSRYFAFIGLQIVTLVMTFLLAMLCRSLMSLGYMIACVPLIMQITDFFNLDKLQQEGRRWNHPYYICGPLMIYSFVDIALQIFCQAPFYASSDFERSFGFDKVYNIKENADFISLLYPTEATMNDRFLSLANGGENLFFLILKSVNLFFIFLQSRIYQSDSFWQFIRQDLRRLLKLAMNYKRMAMTYRYNNWKLQKIVTVQQRKQKMYEGVAELRMKMNYYLNVQKSLLNQQPAAGRIGNTLRQPLLDKIDEEDHRELPESTDTPQIGEQTSLAQESSDGPKQTVNNFIKRSATNVRSLRRVTISKSLETDFKFSQFQDLLKKDDLYFEKKEAYKKIKSKIGRCGKWYLHLMNKKVNQIAFINDIGEAAAVKEHMAQGKRKIQCDLERIIMNDIEIFYHTKENNTLQKKVRRKMGVKLEEDEIQLKDLKKTMNYLRFSNISVAVIGALMQASLSQMATIAYIFMIVSQIHNAGLISIILPFAVFGYALMEEGRPGWFFWRFIKIYILIILFLKFIINLDFINNEAFMENFTAVSNWVLFGLWRTEGIWNFFIYISPEIVILGTVMAQNYYETIIGLYDKREIELENIEEARERFLLQFDQEQQTITETIIKADRQRKILDKDEDEEENNDVNNDEQIEQDKIHDKKILKMGKNIRKIVEELNSIKRSIDDSNFDLVNVQKQRKELVEDIQQNEDLQRRYSLVIDKHERKKLVKKLKSQRPENKGILRNYFGKNKYFKRLFPKVKEAKPGIDFYGKITFVQFVICIYLISYYTRLDARGTQNLENSSQFSFNMVIFLFIQVFVMILERYISRTNTRINLQKARGGKKLDDTELTSKMTLGDNPRSLSIHIQAQKTSDTILFGRSGKSDNVAQSKKILSIELQHTRMTNQQVLKWIIQWALLILYHALVFWFFPLSSNDAIYGTPYCDTTSSQYTKYGCLSFKQNWFIIIFYMIFCYYFMLSALQIRYGYPDFKEPSSLTSTNTLGNVLLYRVFYVLPFLLELKVILDWCFQKTSLDIFQWLELAEVDSELYFFKNGNKGYFERKLGTRIVRFEKCLCGCFCLGVILFFLVGPFFLFSNLSYIADENLVTDATIDFGIKIEDLDKKEVYEFPIFYTDSPLSMFTMSESEYVDKKYQLLPETKFFEPSQVQLIKMKNSSDTEWAVSGDYRNTFRGLIDDTLHGSEQIQMTLEFKYSFTRPGPAEAPVASGSHIRVLNFDQSADKAVLQQLHEVIEMDCEKDPNGVKGFVLLDFIPYQLRLGEKKEVIQLPLPMENVTLSYSCQNYWALNVNLQGLLFITFSDLISSNLFDATSILGFYAGVAVLVGQTLRSIVVYHANRMYITEIPDPDPIRNLISAIYMQRLEQNLKKEEELFFILMEILRSPDIIRVICGSSLRAPLVQPKESSAYNTANSRA